MLDADDLECTPTISVGKLEKYTNGATNTGSVTMRGRCTWLYVAVNGSPWSFYVGFMGAVAPITATLDVHEKRAARETLQTCPASVARCSQGLLS